LEVEELAAPDDEVVVAVEEKSRSAIGAGSMEEICIIGSSER